MRRLKNTPLAAVLMVFGLLSALILGAAGPTMAQSQGPGPEKAALDQEINLDQAIDSALAYSPTLSQIRDALEQAKSTKWQATTGFLPSLDTGYSYQRTQNPSEITTPLGTFATSDNDVYQWSTSVTQPLFTGFRLTSQYKLADLGVDVARLDVRLSILDVVVNVKDAYYTYLVAQKALEVANQAVTQLTSHLKTARDFHEVGILPINDVLKVEVELSNAQQQAVKAENYVALSRSQLNTLLGVNVDSMLRVKDILSSWEPVDFSYKTVRDMARDERPELKAVKLQIQQAQWQVTSAQSEYYPQVGVVGAYDFTSDSANMEDSPYYDRTNWTIAAQATMNLFNWGRTTAEVNKARANVRRGEKALKNLYDQVDLQVKQTYLYMLEAQKNIGTAQTAVKQAEENYRITKERYNEQLTTNTELLDAQTLLTQAQNNYFGALGTYNIAKARLLRAMGRGINDAKMAKLTEEPKGWSFP